MKNRIVIISCFISFFIFSSCNFFKNLPKAESIPFNKNDYNGFYQLGENGKPFALRNNDSLIYYVIKEDFIGLNKVKFARVEFSDFDDSPMLYIELTEKGRKAFKQLTKENIKNKLAVIFNNTLYICPIIQSEIPNGNISISGDFSLQEAVNIVAYINENKDK